MKRNETRKLANWLYNHISKEGVFTPQVIHRFLDEYDNINHRPKDKVCHSCGKKEVFPDG